MWAPSRQSHTLSLQTAVDDVLVAGTTHYRSCNERVVLQTGGKLRFDSGRGWLLLDVLLKLTTQTLIGEANAGLLDFIRSISTREIFRSRHQRNYSPDLS